MNFRSASHTRWIWLLCIVLLAVRMSGAHLHLCFDGSEPPLAVHAGDIAGHDAIAGQDDSGGDHVVDSAIQHSDADLNLIDNGLAKAFKLIALAPALLAALLIICLRAGSRSMLPAFYSTPLFRFTPPRFSAPRAPPR